MYLGIVPPCADFDYVLNFVSITDIEVIVELYGITICAQAIAEMLCNRSANEITQQDITCSMCDIEQFITTIIN